MFFSIMSNPTAELFILIEENSFTIMGDRGI
ncbi:hypothetical protein GGGNBK_04360 [Sporosarcina sp. ANT_H38]